jgi:hypothetical protein
MDGFFQLFGVPRWLSKATRLMAGLEITLSGDMLFVKQVGQPIGIVTSNIQGICYASMSHVWCLLETYPHLCHGTAC